MSQRHLPRCALEWLDAVCPQSVSWVELARSAVTSAQQHTGFDCGVACLLYAEKCGQGQARQDVDRWTDQREITAYRHTLMQFIERVQRRLDAELALEDAPSDKGGGAAHD